MKMAEKQQRINDLRPAGYNPRVISEWQQEVLADSLKKFGDLSGVVYNKRTKQLVGGHQRIHVLENNPKIVKHEHKDSVGTVAIGYIETDFGQLQYREVDWDLTTEKAANIAANKIGGEWDDEKLALMIKDLMEAGEIDVNITGFDDDEINDLLLILDDEEFEDDDDDDGEFEDDDDEKKATDIYDEFMDDITVQQKTLYPSNNEFEIPTLKAQYQAKELVLPVAIWGSVKRSLEMRGTWLFYTGDERYTALTKDPRPVIKTGCVAAAEPNFSSYEQMSYAEGVYRIYQKRWIARFWQQNGKIKILVDLNVSPKFYEANLLGVPDGWSAFCTRGYEDRMDFTRQEFEMACKKAGTEDITFIVYGGGQKVKDMCKENNWVWQQETIEVMTGRQRN